MSVSKTCDICRSLGVPNPGEDMHVLTYGLRRYQPKNPERNYVSAGSIDICQRCWNAKFKPRMVPARGLRRTSREETVAG